MLLVSIIFSTGQRTYYSGQHSRNDSDLHCGHIMLLINIPAGTDSLLFWPGDPTHTSTVLAMYGVTHTGSDGPSALSTNQIAFLVPFLTAPSTAYSDR